MIGRKIHICQRFFYTIADLFRSFLQFHVSEFFCNRFCLFPGSSFILLRMNCFEHQRNLLNLCPRYRRKHIAIKVNDTALIPRFREDFTGCFEHAEALVANNELDALQSAVAQPLKKLLPAFLIFLHPFGCPQNLTVSVFIDCNGHKNGYILIFAAPVPFQINAIHIHIGILSTLEWSVSPLFDVFVCLLVQFADR